MKKKSVYLFFFLILLIGIVISPVIAGTTNYNGWATPTTITYNFSSLTATNDTGTSTALISTPFSVTFNRSDKDLVSTVLTNLTVPFGRYVNIGLCSSGTVGVKLNGVKFDGYGGVSGLHNGDVIYTTLTTNVAGAVTTTGPAAVLSFSSGTACGVTWLPSPFCITDSSQSICKSGDLVYTSSGATTNTRGDGKGLNSLKSVFKLSLLVDLYDGVIMDGSSGGGTVLSVPPVIVIVGDPGATIHLTTQGVGASTPFNASLLFGPDKALLIANITQSGSGVGGAPLTRTCQGSNNIAITNASAYFPYSYLGLASTTENGGLGQVLAPMASTCNSLTTCTSQGTEQIDNIFQAVGSSATLKCIADTNTNIQTINYSKNYTGGAGAIVSGSDTADIVRIVDPKNIFNICTTSSCYDTAITNAGGYY